MRGSWGAAVLCLGVVAAAADPVPPPVRFTPLTRALLADVQARDSVLGTPVDRPGKKLKAAFKKTLALLTAEARTFDADLDSAYKAARLLEKALPEDGDMAALLAAVTEGFGGDLADETGMLRSWAIVVDSTQRAEYLAGLDPVDAALAAAQSLRDFRAAGRKARSPRKRFDLSYQGLKGDPNLFRSGDGFGGTGIPGRPLGAGERFAATGTGMTFDAVGVYSVNGTTMGDTYLLGNPFFLLNGTTISGGALILTGTVDAPTGVPVPVDGDAYPLQVSFATFQGSGTAAYGTLTQLTNFDPGTGTVTFSELDAATGTWAGTFDVTFASGKALAGAFRVSGLR